MTMICNYLMITIIFKLTAKYKQYRRRTAECRQIDVVISRFLVRFLASLIRTRDERFPSRTAFAFKTIERAAVAVGITRNYVRLYLNNHH